MGTNRENAGREGDVRGCPCHLLEAGLHALCGAIGGRGHPSASLPVCGARSGDPGHDTSMLISLACHVVPRKSRV